MIFLPEMEKILTEARKKDGLVNQLRYVFTNAEGTCQKKVEDLSLEDQKNWARFYKLLIPKTILIKKRRE